MENGEESGMNDCLNPKFYHMNHNGNKSLTLLRLSPVLFFVSKTKLSLKRNVTTWLQPYDFLQGSTD